MPLLDLPSLIASLAPNARLIGLDPGARVIGVALSDPGRMIATPAASLRRGKLAAAADWLGALARKEGAGGMIIGLPLSMDGSFGPAAQAARDWGRALSDATGLPAALWDERLSSSAVNRFLIDQADMTRARRAAIVDSMAAAYVLQAALDAARGASTRGPGQNDTPEE